MVTITVRPRWVQTELAASTSTPHTGHITPDLTAPTLHLPTYMLVVFPVLTIHQEMDEATVNAHEPCGIGPIAGDDHVAKFAFPVVINLHVIDFYERAFPAVTD